MPRSDPLFDIRDPARAMVLLTRLPVPGADDTRAAASVWAWPLVGAAIGAAAAALAWAAVWIGLPPAAAAGLALGLGIMATGGLHEDGLADCADGFWGAHTPERRLAIMKDSRVGSFGVLALILGLGLKWALLTALIDAGASSAALIGAAALGRAAMGAMLARMAFARDDGFARHVGHAPAAAAAVGVGIAVGGMLLLAGPGPALAALVAVALTVFFAARLAKAKIGGMTGDVLGATCVVAETAALAAISVFVQ